MHDTKKEPKCGFHKEANQRKQKEYEHFARTPFYLPIREDFAAYPIYGRYSDGIKTPNRRFRRS